MISDIYVRTPQDPNYVWGVYEHSDPIESIITKIKMLLGTSQGQILGDLNMGIGIEEQVFESRISKLELEEKIKTQISQYVSESADYKIVPSISFGKTEGYDYAIVDFFINDNKVVGILIK
jgi:hypothetical protein